VRTHNSRTDSRRIFKLGGGVDHMIDPPCMTIDQGHWRQAYMGTYSPAPVVMVALKVMSE